MSRDWVRIIWHLVAAVILLTALHDVHRLWLWALDQGRVPTYAADSGNNTWSVDGRERKADHVTTSAPNYMGTSGFTVTGWSADDQMIWTQDGVKKVERR